MVVPEETRELNRSLARTIFGKNGFDASNIKGQVVILTFRGQFIKS